VIRTLRYFYRPLVSGGQNGLLFGSALHFSENNGSVYGPDELPSVKAQGSEAAKSKVKLC
jgi:hypothetical protein